MSVRRLRGSSGAENMVVSLGGPSRRVPLGWAAPGLAHAGDSGDSGVFRRFRCLRAGKSGDSGDSGASVPENLEIPELTGSQNDDFGSILGSVFVVF